MNVCILKDEIKDRLDKRGEEAYGIKNFSDMIADDTIGVTEDEIRPFLEKVGHPALAMDLIMG